MKVILCKPNEKPKVVDLPKDHTYLDIKALLEIESPLTCVERKIGNAYYDVWADDEGLYPETKYASGLCINAREILCGNILIAKHDNEGNLIGLTKEQQDKILDNSNWLCNEEFINWQLCNVDHCVLNEDGHQKIFSNYEGFSEVLLHKNGYMLKYLI